MALNPSTEKSLFGFENFLTDIRTTRLPRTERFEVSFNIPSKLQLPGNLSRVVRFVWFIFRYVDNV